LESTVEQHVQAITTRFEALSSLRDRALADGRQIVRISANSVRAIHRGKLTDAGAQLAEAESLLRALAGSIRGHGVIYWAGYVQDAMKEFAEARVTLSIVSGGAIPSPSELGIEDAPYLNALAEAASELRRLVLDTLRGDNLALAERYLRQMDEIYSVLIGVDYPDAVTGGLRRTTDQLRAELERTRGDVTLTLNQRRLERVLLSAENHAPDG
jgi:translin